MRVIMRTAAVASANDRKSSCLYFRPDAAWIDDADAAGQILIMHGWLVHFRIITTTIYILASLSLVLK